MKIGLFADPHYSSAALTCGKRYNSRSLDKIKDAYAHFLREGCALVVCLGDLIDTEETREKEIANLREIAAVMQASSLPTVCLMGNHDAFTLTAEEFYGTLGIPAPRDMDLGGRRLLFLDACYFRDGRHYAPGDSDWTDTDYPHTLALQETLAALDGDAYIFIHQNISPAAEARHRLARADEIHALLRDSGKVKTVFEGHYHHGAHTVWDGVEYRTLPAMCEGEERFFIFEI